MIKELLLLLLLLLLLPSSSFSSSSSLLSQRLRCYTSQSRIKGEVYTRPRTVGLGTLPAERALLRSRERWTRSPWR